MAMAIDHSCSDAQCRTSYQSWQCWQRHTSLCQYPPL